MNMKIRDSQDPYFGADSSNSTKSSAFPCQGVDVSQNQGDFGWDAAIDQGNIKFAFARASIGYNTEDTRFMSYWAAMAKRGILRGAYHFGYPESIAAGMTPAEDAQQEAGYFCDLVIAAEAQVHSGQAMYDGKALPPVLDYEQKPSLDPAAQREWVNAWIATTQARLRRGVIVYSGPNTWAADFAGDPWLTALPFWIAHYANSTAPKITPWTRWVFWQWSGGGSGNIFEKLTGHSFPGAVNGGAVDLNAFWGTETQLRLIGDPSYDRWRFADGTVGANPHAGRDPLAGSSATAAALAKLHEARGLIDGAIADLESCS